MKHLKTASKIILSLGLFGYLVYRADPEKILQVMARVSEANGLSYFVLAILFQLLAVALMSLRWQQLMAGYGYQVGFRKLTGFYLIGLFFNNFLPTSIGGDVMRIYKVVDETGDRTSGFASVIIERILGIAATLSLAIFALFFISQQVHSPRLVALSLLLLIAIVLFFVFIIQKRPYRFLLRMFDKLTFFNIGEKINKLFEAIHFFSAKRRVLLFVFLFSVASQVAIILMNYFLALAFQIQVSLLYLFMVVTVTFVLTILPSINGVGIRDLGYVSLLSRVGVSTAAALSLSFMNLLVPMLVSVSGAVLFMVQRKKDKSGGFDVIQNNF